jgi:hypothetical protein
MSRLRQAIIFSLAALTAACRVSAQSPPLIPQKSEELSSNQSPSTPTGTSSAVSPVTYFRKLLSMSPEELNDYLAKRPPQTRERILSKVHEYEMLSPDERELRLRATELRWYLMPLLQMNPASRNGRLAKIPDDLRDIVKTRLDDWDSLPPSLKQEFIENENALYYFARVQPPADSAEQQAKELQRQLISSQFNQFLELTPKEKEQMLTSLSASERAQMQKALESFGRLSTEQQSLCVQNYAKFANMSATDRAEFLKNAERWSQMSPTERQTWRDLVANVPDWQPAPAYLYPPGTTPGTLPVAASNSQSHMATN